MCLGEDLFDSNVFGKFSLITSLNKPSVPFFLSCSSGTLIMHNFFFLMVSHNLCMLSLLFFILISLLSSEGVISNDLFLISQKFSFAQLSVLLTLSIAFLFIH